jgi:hypothetical protein
MFNEVLKITTKLDDKDTAKLEKNLNNRFGRVSKKFGAGLKNVMKGTFIFAALGLVTKLLDPLKEVEERIKRLIEGGSDIRDLAERFGTSTGKIATIQAVSESMGVTPEKLEELMDKYADAIEQGKKEIEQGIDVDEQSKTTKILKDYLNDTDLAESFIGFLKAVSGTSGADRATIENEVFGGTQKGAARRFIESDFDEQRRKFGGASVDTLSKANDNLAARADQDRISDVKRRQRETIQASGMISPSIIQGLNAAADRKQAEDMKELSQTSSMLKAQAGIDTMVETLTSIMGLMRNALGFIGEIHGFIKKMATSTFGKFFGK